MGTRRALAIISIILAMSLAVPAHAFMMSLGGPRELNGPGGARSNDGADALYALDHFGREIKIAEVDALGPEGIVMQDLGIPSVSDDGNVWFGAAILDGRQLRWKIFSANPDAPLSDPVVLAIPAVDKSQGVPVMRIDPRPIVAADGSVLFSTEVVGGGDAVFRISDGKLIRILRTGARLADGRVVRKVIFGTVQPLAQGEVALSAYLTPGGQAELLVSSDGSIKVIAADGGGAPGGGHYVAGFSPPAAISAGHGTAIAFTARTNGGAGVFEYSNGAVRRLLSTGERCKRGTVSYVSRERPGIGPDGAVAVLAACSGTSTIFMLDGASARSIVGAQPRADYPGQFLQLGEPQLSGSGTLVFGAIGNDQIDRLFAISHGGRMRRIAPRELERFDRPVLDAASEISHTVSAATVSINRHGTIAYLGGR